MSLAKIRSFGFFSIPAVLLAAMLPPAASLGAGVGAEQMAPGFPTRPSASAVGGPLIVEDGRPRAEIVISESALRTVRLAADELQMYLAKISGAGLPVAVQPSVEGSVKLYVGRSRCADRLQISDEGIEHGAYRIVSGKGWLALVGRNCPHQAFDGRLLTAVSNLSEAGSRRHCPLLPPQRIPA